VSRTTSTLIFFGIALAVLFGMHFYVWARLVRDVAMPLPWRRAATVLIVLAGLALPAISVASRLVPRGVVRYLAFAGFTWLGVVFLLLVLLAAADLIRGLGHAAAWLQRLVRGEGGGPMDPARRLFVARAVAGGAAAATAGLAVLGTRKALGEIRVVDVEVKLPRLPRELSGFTIAQLTDIHVGSLVRRAAVERMVALTNGAKPDLVAITGDLVDGTVGSIGSETAPLGNLKARFGTYFITGNHEYYSGVDPWMEELRRLGMRVLRNERVSIGDGASFDLAGIDDWSAARQGLGKGPDLGRALEGRDPERELVLLAHQPKGIDEAVRAGVGLQLSGHTHGGQIFPFGALVALAQPYVAGLHTHREGDNHGQIYVSCGTGFWGPPMRIGTTAEITRVILVSG
jgi:predicted MPP superfamily phosphohydrolase